MEAASLNTKRNITRTSRYPNVEMKCYHCGDVLDYVGETYIDVDEYVTVILTRLKCRRCPCDVEIHYDAHFDIDMKTETSSQGEDVESVDLCASDDNGVHD